MSPLQFCRVPLSSNYGVTLLSKPETHLRSVSTARSNNSKLAGPSMRILMLCDWLPPDFGAVGQYALKFAREQSRAGHRVTLVGFSSELSTKVVEAAGAGSLTVLRIRRANCDKASTWRRARWTLAANCALLWRSKSEFIRADEIRFTGSPPFLLHFVMPLAWLLRRRTRYRITDFHPECLMAMYEPVPPWLSLFHRLTKFWRRRVQTIEVLGEDQRRIILANGVSARRIELVRDPSPVSFSTAHRPAPVPTALQGRHVLLYSGNWGAAHDSETLLRGLAQYEWQHPGTVGLWLNATGSQVPTVERALRRGGVAYARTEPVPLAKLAAVLLAADLHVICLRDQFVGYVLPSKVYACIESQRPILFIGSERSDVHMLCAAAANRGLLQYRRVDVGDAQGVKESIAAVLAASADRSRPLGMPAVLSVNLVRAARIDVAAMQPAVAVRAAHAEISAQLVGS